MSTDDLGYSIEIKEKPQRIISLVPSITETLVDLGVGKRLLGITKFCTRPSHLKERIQQVGGTKNVNFESIENIQPDLIIANKSENTKSDVETLRAQYNTYVVDIENIADNSRVIKRLGKLTGTEAAATNEVAKWELELSELDRIKDKPSVLYLIWKKPYMAAGANTFIDSVLTLVGFENSMSQLRYPSIDLEAIQKKPMAFVFLSSEPYPFKQKDLNELEKMLKGPTKVVLVDGEAFSWFGTTMTKKASYLQSLLRSLTV